MSPVSVGATSTPLCFGRVPTVVLTDGDDHYTTKDNVSEVVWAGKGNDVITPEFNGIAVGDYICGGQGRDVIYDDTGNDHISGGRGDDKIEGGPGVDVLKGNGGDDQISDAPIDSNLSANDDILRGGTGNDTLVTGNGHDRAYGGGGSDDLFDIACSSTYLSGGAGSDYFESFQDSYEGNTCDTRDSTTGNVNPSPADNVVGGSGFDRGTLSYADTTTSVERVYLQYPDH